MGSCGGRIWGPGVWQRWGSVVGRGSGVQVAEQGSVDEAPAVAGVVDEGEVVAALEPGEQALAEAGVKE